MPNMTGRPGCQTMETNGGSSAPYLARTPCAPLFCALFNKGGNRRAFRLPGEGGDHVHCMVEPSPGHIRCQKPTTPQSQNITQKSIRNPQPPLLLKKSIAIHLQFVLRYASNLYCSAFGAGSPITCSQSPQMKFA